MYWEASVFGTLFGIIGGILFVCAFVFGPRVGFRRAVALAGGGLVLLGLSLAGVIGEIARTLAILSFNPLRWVGLAAAGVGGLMLSWSGVLSRGRRTKESTSDAKPKQSKKELGSRGPAAASVGDDMTEIEEILKRRGIQ
ncbi:MAG: hypothetical protein GEU93_17595 [Propionibacteriales bacterium]|nr:hypothetical protein [Propionibacteriales bacterium]